jgi:hypothetical protein
MTCCQRDDVAERIVVGYSIATNPELILSINVGAKIE